MRSEYTVGGNTSFFITSRNTLQSFSFASFVSSDRDSLSHTALTLRLR